MLFYYFVLLFQLNLKFEVEVLCQTLNLDLKVCYATFQTISQFNNHSECLQSFCSEKTFLDLRGIGWSVSLLASYQFESI